MRYLCGISFLSGHTFQQHKAALSTPQNIDLTSAAVVVCGFGSCAVNNPQKALSFGFLQRVYL